MTALEYTGMVFAQGLIFSAVVVSFWRLILWWREHNRGTLYLNTLDALCDVENKIQAFRMGDYPLTSEQALELFKERRYLNRLISEYHDGPQDEPANA